MPGSDHLGWERSCAVVPSWSNSFHARSHSWFSWMPNSKPPWGLLDASWPSWFSLQVRHRLHDCLRGSLEKRWWRATWQRSAGRQLQHLEAHNKLPISWSSWRHAKQAIRHPCKLSRVPLQDLRRPLTIWWLEKGSVQHTVPWEIVEHHYHPAAGNATTWKTCTCGRHSDKKWKWPHELNRAESIGVYRKKRKKKQNEERWAFCRLLTQKRQLAVPQAVPQRRKKIDNAFEWASCQLSQRVE